jgi:hypothetical protein
MEQVIKRVSFFLILGLLLPSVSGFAQDAKKPKIKILRQWKINAPINVNEEFFDEEGIGKKGDKLFVFTDSKKLKEFYTKFFVKQDIKGMTPTVGNEFAKRMDKGKVAMAIFLTEKDQPRRTIIGAQRLTRSKDSDTGRAKLHLFIKTLKYRQLNRHQHRHRRQKMRLYTIYIFDQEVLLAQLKKAKPDLEIKKIEDPVGKVGEVFFYPYSDLEKEPEERKPFLALKKDPKQPKSRSFYTKDQLKHLNDKRASAKPPEEKDLIPECMVGGVVFKNY